jgi:hypothetical protein
MLLPQSFDFTKTYSLTTTRSSASPLYRPSSFRPVPDLYNRSTYTAYGILLQTFNSGKPQASYSTSLPKVRLYFVPLNIKVNQDNLSSRILRWSRTEKQIFKTDYVGNKVVRSKIGTVQDGSVGKATSATSGHLVETFLDGSHRSEYYSGLL